MNGAHSKIVVPIVGPGHREALDQIARAETLGDMVELRLDLIGDSDVGELIHATDKPAIATCRRAAEGGKYEGPDYKRIELLQNAVSAGAAWVDVEYQSLVDRQTAEVAGNLLRRRERTKLILSHHDLEGTPEDLHPLYERMLSHKPDVIKIVTTGARAEDGIATLRLLWEARHPTVAFCMGPYGVASRVLAAKFGAPFTFGSLEEGKESAPGQVTAAALRDIYRYGSIGPLTAVYGVIGKPIGHSLSPHIQNAAFRSAGIDAVYVPFLVDEFEPFVAAHREVPVMGYSVTIPHKEAAARLAENTDELVRSLGACNTLVLQDGAFAGYNTDMVAACDPLERLYRETLNRSLEGVPVLVVGSGGVARAVVHGLHRAGASIVIVNRTASRAESLAGEVGAEWGGLDRIGRERPEVIVNCTSVGMSPNVDATPVDPKSLKGVRVVFDTIYNPERTRLLRDAAEAGCETVTGVEMFIGQGAKQFELWTGRQPDREAMTEAFRKGLKQR